MPYHDERARLYPNPELNIKSKIFISCLEFIFVHFVAKYFFTSNAGCSENCLKFKMPKVISESSSI